MPVDPALEALLAQIDASNGPKLHELTPPEARELYVSMQLPVAEIPLASVGDTTAPGPAGDVPVRVYRPEEADALPCLVYFHGGGWVIGSIETHDVICRDLARRAGCVVVSVDYRLAPEHRYPSAADDCLAVVEWVAANAGRLGIDGARIAVGGDSAGGNLAAVACLMSRDRGGPPIIFQLLVYPVADADFERGSYVENGSGYLLEIDSMRWFWDQYVPDPQRRGEPYAAPLRAEDLSGLPPALVITAEFDPLRDEGEALAARLKSAGVATTCSRYDGMIHGFFSFASLVQGARDAMEEASVALRRVFAVER